MKIAPLLSMTYEVADAPVRLSLVYGNKQLGAATVAVDGKEVARGEITGLSLGKGTALEGKTATIKAVVTDVNDKTNITSIRFTLDGGPSKAQHDITSAVDANGDVVVYRIEIVFA